MIRKCMLLATLLLLLGGQIVAAPPERVRVPSAPVDPAPEPQPGASIRLTSDLMFVIDSDDPLLVLDSPRGHVKLTAVQGPMTVRGKFVDKPGEYEIRTFKGKFLWFVEPASAGKAELLIVPQGTTEVDKVIRRTVQIGTRPPEPDPGPGPNPGPRPRPIDPADDPWGLARISQVESLAINRPDDRAKLKLAQLGTAAAVDAGAADVGGKFSPAKALDLWREGNRDAVDQRTWSAWGGAVSGKLETLYTTGKVKSKADFSQAFTYIANGLE